MQLNIHFDVRKSSIRMMLWRACLTYYITQLQTMFQGSLTVQLLFLPVVDNHISPQHITGFLLIINEWPVNDLIRRSSVIVHFSPPLKALPYWCASTHCKQTGGGLVNKTKFRFFQRNQRNLHIKLVKHVERAYAFAALAQLMRYSK